LVLRENVNEHRVVDDLHANPRFVVPENYLARVQKGRNDAKDEQRIRERYAGYLAATLAIDDYFGSLLETLEEGGILDNTIIVFTSDHGDHLGSHQFYGKNTPFLESTSIPFLLRFPRAVDAASESDALMSPIDIFPTIFGMAGLDHHRIDGKDLSAIVSGEIDDQREALLLMNLTHFNNTSLINNLDTYRGVQTKRYTYARYEDQSPWLLFDNKNDPYQTNNLVGDPEFEELISQLNVKLDQLLKEAGDSENTKSIYDRIIAENPKRQILHDFREANPDKL
jgi:arylsulfatase A-like enzyme